ncbi:MAG: DUF2225 domain-containing protein [Candidatus Omnitrophica bacterium]|nr:DUF2225 domain-containing protein [Candidatus Omnitrophota bacterium]
MSGLKLPFYRKAVKCPVCHNSTDNYVLKSKICMPEEVAPDNYVISYRWIDKNYQECQPSFYALWVCTTCGYADFSEQFQKLLHDTSPAFSKFKEAIIRESNQKDGLIQRLLSTLTFSDEGINFETAMNIHLLTLYCHDVLQIEKSDYEQLGRLYLRNAWLFRDYKKMNIPERPYAGFAHYWEYLQSLKPLWSQIPLDEEKNIRKAAFYYSHMIFQDINYEKAVKNVKGIIFAADLYVLVNDFKKALEIINIVRNQGLKFRKNVMHAARAEHHGKKISRQDEQQLHTKLDNVSRQFGEIFDKHDEIAKKWTVHYGEQIESVFQEQGNAHVDTILEKLRERNIPLEVIEVVKNNDPRLRDDHVAEPIKEKKNFWEFWK